MPTTVSAAPLLTSRLPRIAGTGAKLDESTTPATALSGFQVPDALSKLLTAPHACTSPASSRAQHE